MRKGRASGTNPRTFGERLVVEDGCRIGCSDITGSPSCPARRPKSVLRGWGIIYPNFNLSGARTDSSRGNTRAKTTDSDAGQLISTAGTQSRPDMRQFGNRPSAIFGAGAEEEQRERRQYWKSTFPRLGRQYKLSFRTEVYNLFNRHTSEFRVTAAECSGSAGQHGFRTGSE